MGWLIGESPNSLAWTSDVGYLKKHRRCNKCDARDSQGYTQDPAVFDPVCCHSCSGGDGSGKPPCCYIAHFECPIFFSGLWVVGLATTHFALPCDAPDGCDVFLRPFCEFRDACNYISVQADLCLPLSDAHDDFPWLEAQFACLPNLLALLGCSWQDRGWHQFDNPPASTPPPDGIGWRLPLTDMRSVTLNYDRLGIVYSLPTGVSWDCYGPNNLVLTANPYGCPLPTNVCVTPKPTNDLDICSENNQNRAMYDSEEDRCACCDNYCDCILGEIRIQCSGGGVQVCNGQYCIGGRTGVAGPVGPSRELCCTFEDADLVSHLICVVVYCTGGGNWKADWYCDGTLAGTVPIDSTCCPLTGTSTAPPLPCINCDGCSALMTTCTPPVPLLCCVNDGTLTAYPDLTYTVTTTNPPCDCTSTVTGTIQFSAGGSGLECNWEFITDPGFAFCDMGTIAFALSFDAGTQLWTATGPTINGGDVGSQTVANQVPCPGVLLVFTLIFSSCPYTITITR